MKKIYRIVLSILICVGISFAFIGCIDNNETTKENNFKQYYANACPIICFDGHIGESVFSISFVNNSDMTIDSWNFIYILYDINNEPLICNNDSKYNYIECKGNILMTHSSYSCMYICEKDFSQTPIYCVEVFVYYVLFEDGTTWGCRENISNETITKLATKYKIERYLY